jgi:hypothetical protein
VRAALAVAALPLLACSPQVLDGSLGELLNLHYQDVTLHGDRTQFSVEYTRPSEDGTDTVFEVSAVIQGLDFLPGTVVRLEEPSPLGGQRGHVARQVPPEPARAFPVIELGEFELGALPEQSGQTVSGRFSVAFTNGTAFASGRTVFHSFEALVP